MVNKIEPELQSISAKKAEMKRSYHGPAVLNNPQIRLLFRERAEQLLSDLAELKEKNVCFSPFLEIGAGSVHRSAALINKYPVQGVATDISQNSLRDAPFTLSLLGHNRSPQLIVCDSHHLPFSPNSFNFVFAYQTLHHFENPIPVLAECYRVLAKGGHLFFNEEPLDNLLRRFLRGNRVLAHPPTRIQKLGYRLGLEKVFWDDGFLERSLGMTEARFDFNLWFDSLKPFEIISIEVNKKLRIRSRLNKPVLHSFLSRLIGGNIKGLCIKRKGLHIKDDLRDHLMCLDCNSTKFAPTNDSQLVCTNCMRGYPISDGILRMLPKEIELNLYKE
jgi:SAM-dependent methyltransferase